MALDGGKSYLASKIVALFPSDCLHYVEPYFGGGAVLLAKDPEEWSEVVNDLSYELTNFWSALQGDESFALFQRRVEAIPFSQVEWEGAAADPPLVWDRAGGMTGHAVNFFVRCRQSMAGRMDCFAPLSRTRTRRNMNEQASAWLGAVEGLAAVHARLKRVVILNRPAVEVIRQQDGPKTLFYCDPPYLHETRATTGEYAHEMTEAHHRELLETLGGIDGKFMLSGYESPLYDSFETTHKWKCHRFDLPNNSAGGKEKRRMTECLWCNF